MQGKAGLIRVLLCQLLMSINILESCFQQLSFSAACQDLGRRSKRALISFMQKLRIYNCNSLQVFLKLFDTHPTSVAVWC